MRVLLRIESEFSTALISSDAHAGLPAHQVGKQGVYQGPQYQKGQEVARHVLVALSLCGWPKYV